jgi:DNA-binding transcriptional regulator YhcF (GntR family)
MVHRKPGVEKALEYIKRGMLAGKLTDQLPGIRSLAREAKVSYVTMWRAANKLKQKRIPARQGADAAAGDSDGRPAGAGPESMYESKHLLWQKIKNRLKKDILSGAYPPGQALPSCKELRNRYGVSYRTFKKSLDALTSEEIIRPFKKGYMIPAIIASESTGRVVALGCGWEDGRIWADFQDKHYFRILESECIQSRISLDVVVYYKENDRVRFIHSATGKPYDLASENILGIIYFIANLQVDPREILGALSPLQKPVAVLDVIGFLAASGIPQVSRLMRFFTTTASPVAPQTVAQYLLGLGHTRIAFVSPFHKAPWSKIRHQACASIYRDAGFDGGVEPFVVDRFAYQWDYLQHQGKKTDLQTLIGRYIKRDKPGFSGTFGSLQYGLSKYLTDWNCAAGTIFATMRPLFENALRDPRITAWVMANDFAATLAIDFLKEKNIRAPEDISIIAFDNSLDAMEYQITTYDFNCSGIVTMMLRYVLTPSTVPIGRRGRLVEVEGRIVVRRSTAVRQTSARPLPWPPNKCCS